jgi:two-component system sensor histidine kinase MprB
MTIRRRIALVSALAVGVAIVLIAVGTFVGAKRQVLGQVDDSLLTRSNELDQVPPAVLLAIIGIERGDLQRDHLIRTRPGDFDTSYYQLIFADGRVINIGDDDLILPEPNPDDLDPQGPTLRSVWVDDVHLRIVTTVRDGSEVIFQIARPLTEVDALLGRLAALLLFGGLVGVALAGGLGLLVAVQALKPISRLKTSFGEIAETQSFSERVDVVGNDEVAELSREFNLLLDELESAKQDQARLVRDAGHELRTPLTALRTNLEILRRHEVDPKERAKILAAAHGEVEELAQLIGEVVDLASDRYEEESVGSVDLGEVVQAVADRLEKRKGRGVEVLSDGSIVVGKRNALERAVSNVVGNADKFAPSDTPILVDISEGTVTVRDSGSGFDEPDLPYVFERFYRSDAARSQPGSGLGLSIVKQIVDDHDGEVFARNRASGGAEIGFSLPTDGGTFSDSS